MKLTAASVGKVDRDPLLAIAQGRGEGAQGGGGALGVAVAGGGGPPLAAEVYSEAKRKRVADESLEEARPLASEAGHEDTGALVSMAHELCGGNGSEAGSGDHDDGEEAM